MKKFLFSVFLVLLFIPMHFANATSVTLSANDSLAYVYGSNRDVIKFFECGNKDKCTSLVNTNYYKKDTCLLADEGFVTYENKTYCCQGGTQTTSGKFQQGSCKKLKYATDLTLMETCNSAGLVLDKEPNTYGTSSTPYKDRYISIVCGPKKDPCGLTQKVPGVQEEHKKHGDRVSHDKDYFCCLEDGKDVGRFVEASEWATTKKKKIANGTCEYTENVCGEVKDCFVPTECDNGYELNAKKTQCVIKKGNINICVIEGKYKYENDCVSKDDCENVYGMIANDETKTCEKGTGGGSGMPLRSNDDKCADYDSDSQRCTISKSVMRECFQCENRDNFKTCVLYSCGNDNKVEAKCNDDVKNACAL